ncbi:uncharacterized protein SPSK_08222 [Sporothrix schenckii 1099-18]|uniref:Uncharacterized protein n=1 Tax=Sporothrix schenckii 1099-18 TaxID=1397361 RepID=A0A0F2MID5_SPOSC|nr:uncharacterized protein SPSK_08222 [Sporothrix schenckii 1099-18]KJR88605.1 hypothetical protein SPSK_08222 [Sporothrix schenckii 1099-18]
MTAFCCSSALHYPELSEFQELLATVSLAVLQNCLASGRSLQNTVTDSLFMSPAEKKDGNGQNDCDREHGGVTL